MEGKTAIFSCCGGVIFIISVVMLACCWDTIEPTEFGIKYNTLSKKISHDEVYAGGRYFIGLTTEFITFPSTYIHIEFSNRPGASYGPLNTRTKEGLALTLAISFQVQLIKDKIPQLYEMANMNYKNTFSKIAKDTILQTAGNYEAQSYWIRRQDVADAMMAQLNTDMGSAYATVSQMQVLKIELPSSYEDSIVETQVEVQKKRMKEFERQATLIRQGIKVDLSNADRQIKIINATAQAEAYEIRQRAVAKSLTRTIGIEEDIYKKTINNLNFTNSELNQYIYYISTFGKNYTLLSGVDTAVVSVKP